jgi:flagellar basal-body rod protein FlgF
MDTIASNLANATTPGFRADGVKFDSLLSTTDGRNIAYPDVAQDYISTRYGSLSPTGNTLDFAVRGNGWFSYDSPDGPVYSRDGRVQMGVDGQLRNVSGYPLLDVSGAPIQLDPTAGPIAVAGDGMITQRSRQVGAIGLFKFDDGAPLNRYDNSSVTSTSPAQPVLDFVANGVLQGHVENSNVDPVREITRMIEVQRAFDNITASSDMMDSTRLEALKTLGVNS